MNTVDKFKSYFRKKKSKLLGMYEQSKQYINKLLKAK